ncbi:MAG: hypothetical protein M3R02_05360 [Chloroflexota bacterium]|nr:hypothetical protein [Chloroflexota bacterium]
MGHILDTPEGDEVAAAKRVLDDPSANLDTLLDAAWQLFEANAFPAAAAVFARAIAAGADDGDVAETLLQLLIEAHDWPDVVRLTTDYLDRHGSDLSPHSRLAWATSRFDAVVKTEPAETVRAEAALALLEAAAAAGGSGWTSVVDPVRRSAIEAACAGREASLALIEQDSYAPQETGLPVRALLRAEGLGRVYAADLAFSRRVERVLHAFGAREAAYRVERARRQAHQTLLDVTATADPDPDARLRGLVVLVAGGHPALRDFVRADLQLAGAAEVREIPPAWEANRHARRVRDVVSGSDVAVLVPRQLPHSTSDQVRNAAGRLGVPVVIAESASAQAVRRSLEHFLKSISAT